MEPDTLRNLEVALGDALRERRLAASTTQKQLAMLANVSLTALRALETGSGSSTATLVRVVHALGADDWLRAVAPPPPPFNPLTLLDPPRSRGPRRARSRS